MFTRKHYVRIAKILRRIDDKETRSEVTYRFIDFLKTDNPNFNPRKFEDAVEKEKQ